MLDLDKLVADYKVFVDTCSLMHEKANEFFERQLPASLDRSGAKLIVPLKVVDELMKLQGSEDQSTRRSARKAAKIIKEYKKVGYVDIYGEKNDSFTDNLFIATFTRFRTKYNLMLITQDSKLAQDIIDLRGSQSVTITKEIVAFRIDDSGNLKVWQKNKSPQPPKPLFNPPDFYKFSPTSLEVQVLPVSVIPKTNDYVTSKRYGKLKLGEEIGKGGEGSIFATGGKLVCKIYKKERLTNLALKKLELMVSKPVNISGVCWPKDIVYNANGEFVGYAMEQARGKAVQKAIFVKPLLENNFPNWDKKNLVQLSITILNKIKELNDNNLIIGDLNPLNILINSDKQVYFVDTDSYQIEDFPCPVGTVNYTAPEIQGEHFAKFLRTQEHENFAIATLLFMILLPGKPPYSQQGGGNPRENIKKQVFPYPLGEQGGPNAPQGPWRFIWSHLPYQTKEAFYKTFREDQRKNAQEWLTVIWSYFHSLKREYVSSEIFPTALKPISEHARNFYGANARIDQELICTNCGATFIFSVGEQRHYEERGYQSPKRCPNCRRSRAKV